MLLTVEDLVSLLRSSVNVQNSEAEVIDPAYLTMTDNDIELFIKLGVSRAYPSVTSLEYLPNGAEYPIMLLAKIELYLKLAVLKADKVDMGADNNNYLKLDQRFKHYMKLVQESREQYESWLENEGQGELSSHDVLLSSRHFTNRNYEHQSKPKVRIMIDLVTSDSVDLHWEVSNTSHFGAYKVYISDSTIIDLYRDGATYNSKVKDGAKLIRSTQDFRNNYVRAENLDPNKTYHIAVISVERNQVFGYEEKTITTLEPLVIEPEL